MPQPRSNAGSKSDGSSSSSSGAKRTSSRSTGAKRSGASGSTAAKRTSSGGASAKRSTSASAAGSGAKRTASTPKRAAASTANRASASGAKARGSASSARSVASSAAASAVADPRLEAVASRIRKLNDRIIEAGKDAGETTLGAYEKALKALAASIERGAGHSDVEWVSQLLNTQAKFIRDVTNTWTSAARDALK